MLMTTHAEHITSLFANLVGTAYYVIVAALLVPFRSDLDVGVAGFMVVNACFASLGTTYVFPKCSFRVCAWRISA